MNKYLKKFFDNKNRNIILIIVVLLIVVLMASYAYFTVIGNVATTDISGVTEISQELKFSVSDDDFILDPSPLSLAEEGDAYISAYATATITLTDLPGSGNLEDTYSIAVFVNTNEYEYTTTILTPELLLTVIDPEGNEVTEIAGLTYYPDENGVSGFDVTTYEGKIIIANDYNISYVGEAYGSEVDEWSFTLSMLNLETDQSANLYKYFEGQIEITTDNFSNTLAEQILIDNSDSSTNTAEEAKAYILSKTDGDSMDYFYDENNTLEFDDYRMFATADDEGMSYFMGDNDNIWVKFGNVDSTDSPDGDFDLYWKIIRIDGSSNVKMELKYVYNLDEETSTETTIDVANIITSVFNEGTSSVYDAFYEYPVYDDEGEVSYYVSSDVKSNVDEVYDLIFPGDENKYKEYLASTLYCLGTDAYSFSEYEAGNVSPVEISSEYDNSDIVFSSFLANEGGLLRYSLKCSSNSLSNYYNIGLLSLTEMLFVSGFDNYAKYTDFDYWTISSGAYAGTYSYAYAFVNLESWSANEPYPVDYELSLPITVSIDSDIKFVSGDGSFENPYMVY